MNPRQRRGVLLLAVSIIGAVAVFALVLSYVSSVNDRVGGRVSAWELDRSVTAYGPITAADVKQVRLPAKWLPATAIHSFDPQQGLVAATALSSGSLLQTGMLTEPPDLKPGQRELAILVDAETGVAGAVKAGDLVDIYATYADNNNASAGQARIVVTNARVLQMGPLEQVTKQGSSGDYSSDRVVPITFALSVADSLELSYAESFAKTVRLALVAPGTTSNVPPQDRVLTGPQVLADTASQPEVTAPSSGSHHAKGKR